MVPALGTFDNYAAETHATHSMNGGYKGEKRRARCYCWLLNRKWLSLKNLNIMAGKFIMQIRLLAYWWPNSLVGMAALLNNFKSIIFFSRTIYSLCEAWWKCWLNQYTISVIGKKERGDRKAYIWLWNKGSLRGPIQLKCICEHTCRAKFNGKCHFCVS